MSNAKKFLIIVFTIMLVISLQFNKSLTHKMDHGFSVTQLLENVFIPEIFATVNVIPGNTLIDDNCAVCHPINNTPDCDASDPDWAGCW